MNKVKCEHYSVSGQTPNDWVCNICLFEHGNPSQWSKDNAVKSKKEYEECYNSTEDKK